MRYLSFFLLIFLLTGCGKTTVEVSVEQESGAQGPATESQGTDALNTNLIPAAEVPEIKTESSKVTVTIPATFDNHMSFGAQAPEGNWGLPYQESCEEASLILANNYFNNNNAALSIPDMDAAIKKIVAWETEQYRSYTDSTAAEVAAMGEKYFEGLSITVVTEVTVDRIKKEIADGHVIIAPFAGRDLGNKYFTAPGPLYHMLVIRGYDRDEFITNDVGTRHGEGYKYPYKTLLNAIHDLPVLASGEVLRPYDDKTIDDEVKALMMRDGRRVMLVVKKK